MNEGLRRLHICSLRLFFGALKIGALKLGLLEGRGEALPKNLYTPLCHLALLPYTPFL